MLEQLNHNKENINISIVEEVSTENVSTYLLYNLPSRLFSSLFSNNFYLLIYMHVGFLLLRLIT